MEIANCRYCGRVFQYFYGQELCPKCTSVLEETFHNVKEYIYDNPEAGVHEVAKEFDISINTIYRWVREERLTFSEKSNFGLPCECCGVSIKIGRYCRQCQIDLKNRFSEAYKREEKKKEEKEKHKNENIKMRFLDSVKD